MVKSGTESRTRWGMAQSFTLIELLVVMAIIGVLIGLMFPAFREARNQAKKVRAGVDVRQLEVAWRAVLSDYRSWTMTTSLVATVASTGTPAVMGVDFVKYLGGGNSRGANYMEYSGSSTNVAGCFFDPWGKPSDTDDAHAYRFALGNGSVSPYGSSLPRDVAAWSRGRDTTVDSDDVKSWE